MERGAPGNYSVCWSWVRLVVQSLLDTNVSDKDLSMKAAMRFFVSFVAIMSLNVQAQLPEFTELVEDVSPVVVNISTRSSLAGGQNICSIFNPRRIS